MVNLFDQNDEKKGTTTLNYDSKENEKLNNLGQVLRQDSNMLKKAIVGGWNCIKNVVF